MVPVLNVEITLVQFQIVHVLITISNLTTKVTIFVKSVMSDVTIVPELSTTVLIVPSVLEDLMPHTVNVHKDI
jgi:hypothetical protein